MPVKTIKSDPPSFKEMTPEAFEKIFTTSGMTRTEFAEYLERGTGMGISRQRITDWINAKNHDPASRRKVPRAVALFLRDQN